MTGWACQACIANMGLSAQDGRAFASRGRCYFGKHDVATRIEWLDDSEVGETKPVETVAITATTAPTTEPAQLSLL